jgi:hypothetical protein
MAGSNLNGEADERAPSAAEPANQALLEEVGRIDGACSKSAP